VTAESDAPGRDRSRAAREAGELTFGGDGHEYGASVPKLATGIPGFDDVTMGGLPRRRATVVAGQAGSAKTVFAGQFLAEGVRRGEPGIFVTLEEPADDLRANLTTLGADIAEWEENGSWRFVDASPLMSTDEESLQRHGRRGIALDTLAAQIGHAVDRTGAERLVLDSLNTVLAVHSEAAEARQLLRSLIAQLRGMGLTILMTVETPVDPSQSLSALAIEEFVVDNVLLLHNELEGAVRRRTIEVLKMRGAMHHRGRVPFTVLPGRGVVVLPMARRPPGSSAQADRRLSLGVAGLDDMTHGGVLEGSITLVSGATGTGKTLVATEFVGAGARNGEQGLLLAFEESRQQVERNARGWGHDFARYEAQGLLDVVALYPEIASLDDHFVQITELVQRLEPRRVAIDSLSALARLGSERSYYEFVIRLASFLKQQGIATVMTMATPSLLGGGAVTEGHISAVADGIVLLRYVEVDGAVLRGVTVLKMRGSSHDSEIREYSITGTGMRIGAAFRDAGPILS
jgi:circadian clock protein KaiC